MQKRWQNDICPDEKQPANTPKADEATTFCPTMMWQSNPASSGWASVEITFPFEVKLTQVAVHSRHGGKYHAAEALRVVAKRDGGFRDVVAKPLASTDATVSLPRTKARAWRFLFQADQSRSVVIRGLRFFSGGDEIFPALVPEPADNVGT